MQYGLIVDGSDAIRIVVRRILEHLGFKVGEARDAQQGLDSCRSHLPDFILLDMHLGGTFGFLTSLRCSAGGHATRVIVSGVDGKDPNITRALRAGADCFILKPVNRIIVETTLREFGLLV
jgi:DNA-binding response OmpR family regulator